MRLRRMRNGRTIIHHFMNPDTPISMLARTVFLAASVFAFAQTQAQTPAAAGTFVSTLGRDTIQIERYTRTGDKLEGDIVRRAPRVQIVHYVADLATGRVKGMSVSTRRYGTDAATAPVF